MSTLIGDASALIVAASRSSDEHDIFNYDTAGQIYTAAWEADFGDWRGWWPA